MHHGLLPGLDAAAGAVETAASGHVRGHVRRGQVVTDRRATSSPAATALNERQTVGRGVDKASEAGRGPPGRDRPGPPRALEPFELGNDAARLVEPRVPRGVALIDVGHVVSPLGDPHRLRRLGRTRYWYQEMSHAKVSTVSALTPESGMIETCGSPRALATPVIVRRN